MATCAVVKDAGQGGTCEEPATHFTVSKAGDHEVYVPLCEYHADSVRSSPDVVRAITEARGPR